MHYAWSTYRINGNSLYLGESKTILNQINYTTMETIDIIAKEWFDKINGNSYFSARIITDWSMPDEKTYYLPYQYGYGDQYLQETKDFLLKSGLIVANEETKYFCFTRWCRENGIILRYTKIEKCLKRDVKNFVSNS